MAKWRLKSRRRATGALVHKSSKKKRMQRAREFAETRVGETRKKTAKRRGKISGIILLGSDKANVLDPKTKKIKQSKILLV